MTNVNERSPRDRDHEHLDGHECAACAALLELGPHMAARISETRKDDVRDQRIVARALAAGPRVGRSRRVMVAMSLSAAALLLGSLAAADYLGVRMPWASHTTEAPQRRVGQHR